MPVSVTRSRMYIMVAFLHATLQTSTEFSLLFQKRKHLKKLGERKRKKKTVPIGTPLQHISLLNIYKSGENENNGCLSSSDSLFICEAAAGQDPFLPSICPPSHPPSSLSLLNPTPLHATPTSPRLSLCLLSFPLPPLSSSLFLPHFALIKPARLTGR